MPACPPGTTPHRRGPRAASQRQRQRAESKSKSSKEPSPLATATVRRWSDRVPPQRPRRRDLTSNALLGPNIPIPIPLEGGLGREAEEA
eukprot:scaffold274488_cov31-Tisochrysis_lutea.AAC.1